MSPLASQDDEGAQRTWSLSMRPMPPSSVCFWGADLQRLQGDEEV